MRGSARTPAHAHEGWVLAALAGGLALLLAFARSGGGAGAAALPRPAESAVARGAEHVGPLADAPWDAGGRGAGSDTVPAGTAPAAPREAVSPATEGEHYERFLLRLRAGGSERELLEADAARLLLESASASEQVGLLRAFGDAGSARAAALFRIAFRELPDASDAHADSVPSFVVRHLGERAARDPVAWRTLHEALRGAPPTASPALRGRALARLVETAREDELPLALAELEREGDELARALGEAARRARATTVHDARAKGVDSTSSPATEERIR